MPLNSKWDNKCKDCGVEFKAGELVDKNQNGNWCKNWETCSSTQANVQQPTTSQQTSLPATNLEERIEEAKKVTTAFIELCKTTGAEGATLQAASVWNTVMMRK